MSPCSSRTQAPSLRSMAGNRIMTGLARPRAATPCRRARAAGVNRAACGKPGTNEPPGASWLPLQEVGDQPQAQALALLRVELGADHGAAADDGADRPALVSFGDEIGALGCLEVERMHEIGVQSVRPHVDAVE